jgi:hypothetical protein
MGHVALLFFSLSLACFCLACNPQENIVTHYEASNDFSQEPPVIESSSWTVSAPPSDNRQVLEVAPDGRLIIGKAKPTPPHSSAKLLFSAAFIDSNGIEHPLPIQRLLQDIRFAYPPSALLALLDDRDELFIWNSDTDFLQNIDSQVFPGFGFSHDGTALVYSKGLRPELEAFQVSLPHDPSKEPVQLSFGAMPVWGFAFSPDDTQIVYVDAPHGFPCLTLMPAEGGAREKFSNRTLGPQDLRAGQALAPFPDGRRPPLWLKDRIVVEDTKGIHGFDLLGNLQFSRPGRMLHLSVSGQSAFFIDGKTLEEARP